MLHLFVERGEKELTVRSRSIRNAASSVADLVEEFLGGVFDLIRIFDVDLTRFRKREHEGGIKLERLRRP